MPIHLEAHRPGSTCIHSVHYSLQKPNIITKSSDASTEVGTISSTHFVSIFLSSALLAVENNPKQCRPCLMAGKTRAVVRRRVVACQCLAAWRAKIVTILPREFFIHVESFTSVVVHVQFCGGFVIAVPVLHPTSKDVFNSAPDATWRGMLHTARTTQPPVPG